MKRPGAAGHVPARSRSHDREQAEMAAAQEIRAFYGDGVAPLPDGVTEPDEAELRAADLAEW